MNTNGFREEELINRKVKVGEDWQTKTFPVFGGRLRLAHEGNKTLSLETEMMSRDGQCAVFKCLTTTGKGLFVGFGSANTQRDSKLSDSLNELAETRSCTRALRFAGYGLEFTNAEEMPPVNDEEGVNMQGKTDKGLTPIFPDSHSKVKTGTKHQEIPRKRPDSQGHTGSVPGALCIDQEG